MGTHSNYQINTYRVITKSLQNQNPQARKHESDKKDDLSPHEAEWGGKYRVCTILILYFL